MAGCSVSAVKGIGLGALRAFWAVACFTQIQLTREQPLRRQTLRVTCPDGTGAQAKICGAMEGASGPSERPHDDELRPQLRASINAVRT